MDLLLIPRQTIRIPRSGSGPRRTPECEIRGFCGPFANEALYNAFPEAMWHGMGDCLECGTTRHVSRDHESRTEADADASAA